VLGLLALAATPTAVVAVNTGSQCVTFLLDDSETAGPLPSRLTSLLSPREQPRLARCDHCASYPALGELPDPRHPGVLRGGQPTGAARATSATSGTTTSPPGTILQVQLSPPPHKKSVWCE
jgi:hypothetical protein